MGYLFFLGPLCFRVVGVKVGLTQYGSVETKTKQIKKISKNTIRR